ncbi:MAG: class I SAM-dependent DNA methyltransferase [Thermacetogeniaceae bacterium]
MQEKCYGDLAPFYDAFMEGVPYEEWVNYVEEIIKKFHGKVTKVVDLACGTGNSTLPWASRGYKTWGIDASEEMLKIARGKAKEKRLQVEFICQNMCGFQLKEPVDLAVCFQEGFNYILDTSEMERAFSSVYNNLTDNGFFIFDLNYLPLFICRDEEESFRDNGLSLVWRSHFLKEQQIWEIEIKGSIKDRYGNEKAFQEKHREKIYKPEDIRSLLTLQNFTVLGTYQAFTFSPPHDKTTKIVFVAQKI